MKTTTATMARMTMVQKPATAAMNTQRGSVVSPAVNIQLPTQKKHRNRRSKSHKNTSAVNTQVPLSLQQPAAVTIPVVAAMTSIQPVALPSPRPLKVTIVSKKLPVSGSVPSVVLQPIQVSSMKPSSSPPSSDDSPPHVPSPPMQLPLVSPTTWSASSYVSTPPLPVSPPRERMVPPGDVMLPVRDKGDTCNFWKQPWSHECTSSSSSPSVDQHGAVGSSYFYDTVNALESPHGHPLDMSILPDNIVIDPADTLLLAGMINVPKPDVPTTVSLKEFQACLRKNWSRLVIRRVMKVVPTTIEMANTPKQAGDIPSTPTPLRALTPTFTLDAATAQGPPTSFYLEKYVDKRTTPTSCQSGIRFKTLQTSKDAASSNSSPAVDAAYSEDVPQYAHYYGFTKSENCFQHVSPYSPPYDDYTECARELSMIHRSRNGACGDDTTNFSKRTNSCFEHIYFSSNNAVGFDMNDKVTAWFTKSPGSSLIRTCAPPLDSCIAGIVKRGPRGPYYSKWFYPSSEFLRLYAHIMLERPKTRADLLRFDVKKDLDCTWMHTWKSSPSSMMLDERIACCKQPVHLYSDFSVLHPHGLYHFYQLYCFGAIVHADHNDSCLPDNVVARKRMHTVRYVWMVAHVHDNLPPMIRCTTPQRLSDHEPCEHERKQERVDPTEQRERYGQEITPKQREAMDEFFTAIREAKCKYCQPWMTTK